MTFFSLTQMPIDPAINVALNLSPQELLRLATTSKQLRVIAINALFMQKTEQALLAQQKIIHWYMNNPLLFTGLFNEQSYRNVFLPALAKLNITYQLMGLWLKKPSLISGKPIFNLYLSNKEQSIWSKPQHNSQIAPADMSSWFSKEFISKLSQVQAWEITQTRFRNAIKALAGRFEQSQLKSLIPQVILMALHSNDFTSVVSVVTALALRVKSDAIHFLEQQQITSASQSVIKFKLLVLFELQPTTAQVEQLINYVLLKMIHFNDMNVLLRPITLSAQTFNNILDHIKKHSINESSLAMLTQVASFLDEEQTNLMFEQLTKSYGDDLYLNGGRLSLLRTLIKQLNVSNWERFYAKVSDHIRQNDQDQPNLILTLTHLFNGLETKQITYYFNGFLELLNAEDSGYILALAGLEALGNRLNDAELTTLTPQLVARLTHSELPIRLDALHLLHKLWFRFQDPQNLFFLALMDNISHCLVEYEVQPFFDLFIKSATQVQLTLIITLLQQALTVDIEHRTCAYSFIATLEPQLNTQQLKPFVEDALDILRTTDTDPELRRAASYLIMCCAEKLNQEQLDSIQVLLPLCLQDDNEVREHTACTIKAIAGKLDRQQANNLFIKLQQLIMHTPIDDESYRCLISIINPFFAKENAEIIYQANHEQGCQQLLALITARIISNQDSGTGCIDFITLLSGLAAKERATQINCLVAIVGNDKVAAYERHAILKTLGRWALLMLQSKDMDALQQLIECIDKTEAPSNEESLLLHSLAEALSPHLVNDKKRKRNSNLMFSAELNEEIPDRPEVKRICS